ncbi:CCHamide [Operophtera brumata]|uniref:CCHamide n=1 Tax=Operophtera brumata TaxID=104452 RepID=A0A0L7LBS9_OPEBR|nr:CCHamide [Operophtera brumata]
MAQTMLAVAIIAVLVMCQGVSAKRGCSAFGHSCFGGHGKRSGDTGGVDISSQDLIARHQMGQEETPPHPGYPHYNALQPGDDIIPIRDGGVFDREDAGRDLMKIKLRNIFKHWKF